MIYPIRILVLMALTLVLIAAGCALAYQPLSAAFLSNPVFNAAMLGVLAIGITTQFGQAAALIPATRWVERTSRGFATKKPPRVMAPVARVLAGREREGFTLSMFAMRALLDAARIRLKEARDLSFYFMGLLVLLGIAGALWPLIGAPDARLRLDSLLFGLASAVVLGVLHLELRHAQSAFFGELEEFLAQRAQLPSALLGSEGALPAYLEALLKQAAESLTDLQRLMTKADEERSATQAAIKSLTEELASLSDQLRAEHKVITALSKSHNELQPAMRDFANELASGLAGAEELRNHVRKMDLSLAQLLGEVAQMREQLPQALRQEVRVLAQTLAR